MYSIVLILSVLIVAPFGVSLVFTDGSVVDTTARTSILRKNNNAPANVQYMEMNHEGEYSFAYASADSSRQERRSPDGSVIGKYTYTDPNGKLVKVDYTADAKNGFNAYGDNLPTLTGQVPTVVQDTPAVNEARLKFLDTYAREYARVQQAQALENSKASVFKNLDKIVLTEQPEVLPGDTNAVIIPSLEKHLDSSEETKIYSAATGFESQIIQSDTIQNSNLNNGIPTKTEKLIVTQKSKPSPAYFYYVGVGEQPYYVHSSPVQRNTNLAVSVRASHLQALPVSAIHDVQVPNYENIIRKSHSTQPLYVEIGKDYEPANQYQYHPKQNFGFRKALVNKPTQQPHYGSTTTTVFTLPYFGYPTYIY